MSRALGSCCAGLIMLFGGVTGAEVYAWDWSGSLGLESRLFEHNPVDPAQHDANASLIWENEWSHEWDDGRQIFAFSPYLRIDQGDAERSHADIRELTWVYAGDDYEWRLGVRKVFWGVTESQHLVDIINQTDLVVDTDTEDKLGQPMVNLALIRDWGTVDLFVLPYFRERTFPGRKGRLRTQPRVLVDRASYESDQGQGHIDLAARWSKSVDIWDIGFSHFWGTGRDPVLSPAVVEGEQVLLPRYVQIQQTGVDIQATIDAWLWKLEAIRRAGNHTRFTAATAGFEYSLFGVWDTRSDLGIVIEYLFDSRQGRATTPFEHDLMTGLRLAMNDEQSSEALLGMITDIESGTRLLSIEASRRLGDAFTLELIARKFIHPGRRDLSYAFRNDDYLQVDLAWHY